jgi:hypothetical protein
MMKVCYANEVWELTLLPGMDDDDDDDDGL